MNHIEIRAAKIHQALCAAFPNEKTSRFVSAIICAAGSGERMGGISKQLYPLQGMPCIFYTIRAFQNASSVDEIVLVIRPDEDKEIRKIILNNGFDKVKKVVFGGKTRAESVQNGFFAIDPKADLVAIHDGDRPLIKPDQIDRVVKDAIRYGAATAASPLTDSVKAGTESGMIDRSVPRENLYTVQTPQVFLTDMYRVSLAVTHKNKEAFTDDNSMVEKAGFKVKLCLLDDFNIKLTLPGDGNKIELVLKGRSL